MTEPVLEVQGQSVIELPVGKIVANRYQPRERFDEELLKELAASIKEHGLQQPIVVRVHPQQEGNYELVMGERRLRATKLLGLTTIHAIIREYTDEQMQELALIENIQRDDLGIMEEARSLLKLQERLGSVQLVADKVSKSVGHVTRRIALLGLPAEVQVMIDEGKIVAAHAEVILDVEGPDHQIEAARWAAKLNLSAATLHGRMLKHMKPKASNGPGASAGVVKYSVLSATLMRLFEAVVGFNFPMLRDENKRGTLKKQMNLLRGKLDSALGQLNQAPADNAEPMQNSEEDEE